MTIGRRDRAKVFRDTCAASRRDLFDARYPRGHVFLKILLCHPDYQRRGAGRALTLWGIDEARRLGLNTTVFASPMGLPLYESLGFREVGRFRVQLEGDDVALDIPALVLDPDSDGGEYACRGRRTHEYDYHHQYHHQHQHHHYGRRHQHGREIVHYMIEAA